MPFVQFLNAVRRHLWSLLSCALFTFLGMWITYADKNNAWAIKAMFVLAGFCLFLACFFAWKDERNALQLARTRTTELENKLNAIPLDLNIEISDVFHRASVETHSYWNTDFFLLVSANLNAPQVADIEYGLEIILQGRTIHAKWIKDIDRWCRAKFVQTPDPFVVNEGPAYFMDELSPQLRMGMKADGWLHFRLEGLAADGTLAKCKLRLIASSKHGAANDEKAKGQWPIVRRDFHIKLKNPAEAYAERSPQNPQSPQHEAV